MTRKIYIRDGSDRPQELVIYNNDAGQELVVGMTDDELTDFYMGLGPHARAAWQRIKARKKL